MAVDERHACTLSGYGKDAQLIADTSHKLGFTNVQRHANGTSVHIVAAIAGAKLS